MTVEYITVHGLPELRDALLRKIPEHMRGPVLQKALAYGCHPIIDAARAFAPEGTGALKRAIYAYRDTRGSKPGGTFESRFIGVKHGKRTKGGTGDPYYWRFIEFGRGVVTVKNRRSLGTPAKGFFGRQVAAYPAHPFLRPAFDGRKQAALVNIVGELAVQIHEAAKNASWRGSFNAGSSSAASAVRSISSATSALRRF